jgi:hypothetical protein
VDNPFGLSDLTVTGRAAGPRNVFKEKEKTQQNARYRKCSRFHGEPPAVSFIHFDVFFRNWFTVPPLEWGVQKSGMLRYKFQGGKGFR